MLKGRKGEEGGKLLLLGYMIAVEVEDDVEPTFLMERLGDSLTWVDGVGKVDIDFLGEIEFVDEGGNGDESHTLKGEVLSSSSEPDLSKGMKES